MHIEQIFISAERGSLQTQCASISVEAGAGIIGDRNFGLTKYAGQNLTLIEAEEIENFCFLSDRNVDLSLTRRNLITRGIRLNELLGKEFSVGDVMVKGVELCEPCSILSEILCNEKFSKSAVVKYWVNRGGLRVDVITSGKIEIGSGIKVGK